MFTYKLRMFLIVTSVTLAFATACMVGAQPKGPAVELAPPSSASEGPQHRNKVAKAERRQKATRVKPKTISYRTYIVKTKVLNIRSDRSLKAPVVGQLTYGSSLPLIIQGDWGQLGEGQFVHAKFLSPVENNRGNEVAARK